jgi:geranylgeranyl diphosphate synthase type I
MIVSSAPMPWRRESRMTLKIPQPEEAKDTATEILSHHRQAVDPALREAVAEVHRWPGEMAAYTFGWTDRDGSSLPAKRTGGKGVRPAFVLLCAQAMGARADAAIAGAVAVELVHAFSLVHDDIMDGDERRRNRETTWKVYGVGPAVLTGDALLALAFTTLARAPGHSAVAAMEQVSKTLMELIGGQAEDISFEHRPWTGPAAVTVEEYLAMAEAKTGSLLGCAAAIGTLLGGGTQAEARTMHRMGRHAGIAFQITDDLLGIWGDPSLTGKSASTDLRTGKKTLPLLAALQADTAEARRLAELLDGTLNEPEKYLLARQLIEDAGGRTLANRHACIHLERVLHILDGASPADPTAYKQLATLSHYLIHRTR